VSYSFLLLLVSLNINQKWIWFEVEHHKMKYVAVTNHHTAWKDLMVTEEYYQLPTVIQLSRKHTVTGAKIWSWCFNRLSSNGIPAVLTLWAYNDLRFQTDAFKWESQVRIYYIFVAMPAFINMKKKEKQLKINFMQTGNICLWPAAGHNLPAQLFPIKK